MDRFFALVVDRIWISVGKPDFRNELGETVEAANLVNCDRQAVWKVPHRIKYFFLKIASITWTHSGVIFPVSQIIVGSLLFWRVGIVHFVLHPSVKSRNYNTLRRLGRLWQYERLYGNKRICRLEFPTGNYDRPYSPDRPAGIAYYLLDHLSTFWDALSDRGDLGDYIKTRPQGAFVHG